MFLFWLFMGYPGPKRRLAPTGQVCRLDSSREVCRTTCRPAAYPASRIRADVAWKAGVSAVHINGPRRRPRLHRSVRWPMSLLSPSSRIFSNCLVKLRSGPTALHRVIPVKGLGADRERQILQEYFESHGRRLANVAARPSPYGEILWVRWRVLQIRRAASSASSASLALFARRSIRSGSSRDVPRSLKMWQAQTAW